MSNATGSNNIEGLLGGLTDVIDTVLGFAERKIADFVESVETDDEPVDPVAYKMVSELGLADALVLDDGSWQVMSIKSDGFDFDIVSVTLETGESYDLLRTALVRVV